MRLKYLDSLRGIAALSVVCSHFFFVYQAPDAIIKYCGNTPLRFWFDGFAAVSLFFVLSGYVLTYSLTNSAHKIGIGDFFSGRVKRVWLPYLAAYALIATVIFLFTPYDSSGIVPSQVETLGNKVDIKGLFLYPFGKPASLSPQAWSLSIEIAFSIVALFCIRALETKRLYLVYAALAVSLFCGEPAIFIFHFLLGSLLVIKAPRAVSPYSLFLVGIASFILYTSRYNPIFQIEILQSIDPSNILPWVLTAIGSAALIYVSNHLAFFRKLLENSTLSFLGKTSYSVYLLHFFVISYPTLWFLRALAPYSKSASNWYLALLFTLGCTIILAYFFNKYVEDPIIQIFKHKKHNAAFIQAKDPQKSF